MGFKHIQSALSEDTGDGFVYAKNASGRYNGEWTKHPTSSHG